MSNKDWTDKLPELLEGYTEAEPAGLWDAVQAGLVPKRRGAAVWWYAGAALLAAAAVVAAVILLWPVRPSGDVSVVPGNVLADSDVPVEIVVGEGSSPSSDEPLPPQPRRTVAADGSTSSGIEIDNQFTDKTEEPVKAEKPVKAEEPVEEEKVEEPVRVDPFRIEEMPKPKKKKRPATRVQVGVSTTGYFAEAIKTQATVGISSNPGMRGGALTKASDVSVTYATPTPYMLNRNKKSTTDSRHMQDSRISLAVRYNMDYRWGIESGIVSSSLKSIFDTSVDNTVKTVERNVYYVGIPLYLCYNALEWKRFSIYLSAGPMFEMSTGTDTTESVSVGGRTGQPTTDSSRYDDTKWSLNANAGMQLRVFNHSAIFLQPGFSYHFKDNSKLETFYTENPAAFNITFGYRLLF